MNDPYETLKVAPDAAEAEIKKAYRSLARQNHPDLNPGDAAAEERFKQASIAYEVLSDPEKRRNFDEFGEVSMEPGFDPERMQRAKQELASRFARVGVVW